MNSPKPIYLLAGGKGSNNDLLYREIFKETSTPDPLIAYIGAANHDDKSFFNFIGSAITGAGKCKLEHAVMSSKKANLGKAREILQKADAIFISGGDVEAGMEILAARDMINVIRELYNDGKVFFGVSAGSIMLGKEWVRWRDPDDDSTVELFQCIGLAPLICDTHAEGDDWEELKAALQLKADSAVGYGIPSGVCLKVYPDGHLEAIGGAIVRYQRKGKRVIRSQGLLPE